MSNLLNFQDIESTNRGLNFNAIPEDMPPLCLIIIYIISIKYSINYHKPAIKSSIFGVC